MEAKVSRARDLRPTVMDCLMKSDTNCIPEPVLIAIKDFMGYNIWMEGNFYSMWETNGSGQGQFSRPEGITVAHGEVFVADGKNHRIQVLSLTGGFQRILGSKGSGQGQLNYPTDVAVAHQEVFVTECNNHRVQVFTLQGDFKRMWGKHVGTSGSGQELM